MPRVKSTKKSAPKETPVATESVLYPTLEIRLYHSSEEVMKAFSGESSAEPLTIDIAKELLGWEEKTEENKADFRPLLTDYFGKEVRCLYNLTNRPYYPQLAEDYKLEILRRKWKFNCETIKVDKTGMVHDGQHRLIGLILACQEWKKDQGLPEPKRKWSQFWPDEPYIETLVGLGIDGDDDTVNTIGTGKVRTLTDVLYRCSWFADKPEKDRQALARIASYAIKLLWWRTEQAAHSFAPRRPHSESMDFIARHERLLECVRFIHSEAGGTDKLSAYVSLGYAAGLLYLMGSATSDVEAYRSVNAETALDWKLWDKAQTFWIELANNGKKTEGLSEALLSIPVEAGGAYARDLRVGMIIKGWNLFSDGEKVTREAVELETGVDDSDRPIITETPRIGGIDVDSDIGGDSDPEAGPSDTIPEPVAAGDCPKGGDHEWTEEDGERFCGKCKEPAPKKGKRKG